MMATYLVGLLSFVRLATLLFCIQEFLVLQLASALLGGRSDKIEEKGCIDGIKGSLRVSSGFTGVGDF